MLKASYFWVSRDWLQLGFTTTGGSQGVVRQSPLGGCCYRLLTIFSNFFSSWLMFQGTGSAALQEQLPDL